MHSLTVRRFGSGSCFSNEGCGIPGKKIGKKGWLPSFYSEGWVANWPGHSRWGIGDAGQRK